MWIRVAEVHIPSLGGRIIEESVCGSGMRSRFSSTLTPALVYVVSRFVQLAAWFWSETILWCGIWCVYECVAFARPAFWGTIIGHGMVSIRFHLR